MKFWLLYSTVGKKREAQLIARHLLKKRLIACANIFPIDSLYWWKGRIEHSKEYGMIFKTSAKNYLRIEQELSKIHPYECPCLVAIDLKRGIKPYLDWILDSIGQRE
uniref:Divalent-cation tolerance protein CutA n=1 Tax=candidate division WOR-3 bacterium TaxID=2052148 RepID=A0A7C6EGH3_UNCW3